MTPTKDDIRARALEGGAVRCGFARCEPVSADARRIYDEWVSAGRHGQMQYCAQYRPERDDPRLLLDGAQTVISCAYVYGYPNQSDCIISEYARGLDYHIVVRDRLLALGQYIESRYGGQTRPLVDTAPMRERYWAVRSGLGYIGINNQLIIPGIGSRVFLGELLWTGALDPDAPCRGKCSQCMACVRACPGHALDGAGGCDARRCLSYLTIESRDPIPADIPLADTCYGCDACLRACPEGNLYPDGALPEFAPRPQVAALTPADIAQMGSSAHKRLCKGSPLRRVPLPRLKYLAALLTRP